MKNLKDTKQKDKQNESNGEDDIFINTFQSDKTSNRSSFKFCRKPDIGRLQRKKRQSANQSVYSYKSRKPSREEEQYKEKAINLIHSKSDFFMNKSLFLNDQTSKIEEISRNPPATPQNNLRSKNSKIDEVDEIKFFGNKDMNVSSLFDQTNSWLGNSKRNRTQSVLQGGFQKIIKFNQINVLNNSMNRSLIDREQSQGMFGIKQNISENKYFMASSTNSRLCRKSMNTKIQRCQTQNNQKRLTINRLKKVTQTKQSEQNILVNGSIADQALVEQLTRYKRQCEIYLKTIKQKNKEIHENDGKYKKLEKYNQNLVLQMEELRNQIKQFEKIHQDKQSRQKEKNKITQKIVSDNSIISKELEQELFLIQEELHKRDQEYIQLFNEHYQLKEELNRRNEELNEEKKIRYDLQNQLKYCQVQINMLNRIKFEVRSKNDQIAKLQNMNSLAKNQINLLRKELESIQRNSRIKIRKSNMGSSQLISMLSFNSLTSISQSLIGSELDIFEPIRLDLEKASNQNSNEGKNYKKRVDFSNKQNMVEEDQFDLSMPITHVSSVRGIRKSRIM